MVAVHNASYLRSRDKRIRVQGQLEEKVSKTKTNKQKKKTHIY
jgi:hypothetical protein